MPLFTATFLRLPLRHLVFLALLISPNLGLGQVLEIGFYNVENLFDAEDDALTFDDDYTPKGRQRWTSRHVEQKINQLAQVIAAMAQHTSSGFPVLLGLAEAENYLLLEQLTAHPLLRNAAYAIIHFDSPDPRGIDVALLYQPDYFLPTQIKKYPLFLKNPKTQNRLYTRDQLLVSGLLAGEQITVSVNHWPSRRGGQATSAPLRMTAARLQQRLMDSLYRTDPQAKIVVMGDFNDNPDDQSLLLLQTHATDKETFRPLTNPFLEKHKKGMGSLAFRDRWFLFDQVLISPAWMPPNGGLRFKKARIFNPHWLYTPSGRYKNYPYRTQKRGRFLRGYSDHFPVLLQVENPKN